MTPSRPASNRPVVARAAAATLAAGLLVAACGGDDDATSDAASDAPAAEAPADDAAPGIRVVSAADAAATIADPPEGLVILDVRTPAEFDEAHIDGAILVDFNSPSFADDMAELDPDVPYVLYCRSGNRSAGARAVMSDLGFVDVEDIDGGIVAWVDAGLPIVTG